MSFNFINFFIFWKFLVPPGGTAGPLATPLHVTTPYQSNYEYELEHIKLMNFRR